MSSKAQAASAPQTSRETCSVQVLGYTWGTSTFYLPNRYGKPAPPHTTPSCFDRIIVADCLWMPSQHINLIKTILQFLPLSSTKADGPQAGPEEDQHKSQTTDFPCALVIAGFHTGRRIVSDFFSLATESQPSPQREESQTPNMGNDAKYKLPDPATANTISIDPSTLTPSERSACGILRLASIFEVDVEGNVRAWEKERVGEGKWDAKRWCVVGVLIRP